MYVTSPSRPTGPRAWSLLVETPTSAPKPYRKPSAKRVEAFDEDPRGVDLGEEPLRRGAVLRDDGVRVLRPEAVDMVDRLAEAVHGLHGENERPEFPPEVALRGRHEAEVGRERPRRLARADLDSLSAERRHERAEEPHRRLAVEEKRLGGVAGRRIGRLASTTIAIAFSGSAARST